MNPLARCAVVALVLLSSACGTTINTKMQGWLGRSISEAVADRGAPNRTAELPDGQTVHTWQTIHDTDTCTVSFVSDSSGKIVSYSFETCPGRGHDSGSGHL